jgi:putative ABC transport system permease protein
LKLVMKQGLLLTVVGTAIGVAVALIVTRFLASMLFEVSTNDFYTFAAVSSLTVLVTLLACYLPARRAMRVDPMVALRYE